MYFGITRLASHSWPIEHDRPFDGIDVGKITELMTALGVQVADMKFTANIEQQKS